MFKRADVLRSILPEDPRPDAVFTVFVDALAAQLDAPVRVRPLLAEALGELQFDEPRSAPDQVRELLAAIATEVFEPRFSELAASGIGDALARGDLGVTLRVLRSLGREQDSSLEWADWDRERWRIESLGALERAVESAATIASLGAVPMAGRLMGSLAQSAALCGNATAGTALAVVALAESAPGKTPRRSSTRRSLPFALSRAKRSDDFGAPASTLLDPKNRFGPLLFAVAPEEAEVIDSIFATVLFELVERVDLPVRTAPALVVAIRKMTFRPPQPAPDQIYDAVKVAFTLVGEDAVAARRYADVARGLRESAGTPRPNATWSREVETWSPALLASVRPARARGRARKDCSRGGPGGEPRAECSRVHTRIGRYRPGDCVRRARRRRGGAARVRSRDRRGRLVGTRVRRGCDDALTPAPSSCKVRRDGHEARFLVR